MKTLEKGILGFWREHREVMEGCCRRETLRPGTTLFREGDTGDEAFIIERGEVVISRDVDGKEKAIAVACQGDIVGEIAPFSGNTRTASARTNSGADVIVFDRASLFRLKAEHPDIVIELYEEILRVVTGRLRGSIDRYEVIYHLLK